MVKSKKIVITIFQSTHSQGVRQQLTKLGQDYVIISIHALTRSATYKLMDAFNQPLISIHALTRSATYRK